VGTGKNFAYYAATARAIASDLAWPMLARARRRLGPRVLALLVADVARLPIRDASVDTVTATFVCCVQDDPRSMLGEITRVLRPGGQALFLEFALPARSWLYGLMHLMEPPLRTLCGLYWRRDLPTLLTSSGWKVSEERVVWGSVVQAIVATKTVDSA
jgi:ubiquinone/menaquinone biosynthesis C-methylase UbiE